MSSLAFSESGYRARVVGEVLLEPKFVDEVERQFGIASYLDRIRERVMGEWAHNDSIEFQFDVNSNRIMAICICTAGSRRDAVFSGIRAVSMITDQLIGENILTAEEIKFPQVKKIGVTEITGSDNN